MWADNETDRDFLNFSGVADTVAEIVLQAKGRPISIGVSGQWGTGKSSMIRLIRAALEQRDSDPNKPKFLFVEFNAWLYQGYDDARAALMDVIVAKLAEAAGNNEGVLKKTRSLLRRVNWLRLGKMVASSAISLSLGLPPTGVVGGVLELGKRVFGKNDTDAPEDDDEAKKDSESDSLLEDAPSPSKEIQALRESFEETLQELGVTLVVLIDDLDRCLPKTTISTLEAIRLFLFLKNTAFVIAADDAMIKHA
ncbi:MAG TPA: P-loop NTPase fold protein, partial [Rhodanobacteraceae bacterium]|nr:P-loop NTPase fold protein [Rhodanobacteraceae bacterium]